MSDTTRHKENNTVIDEVQGGEKKVMTKFNKRIINVLATATLVAGVAAPVTAIVAPSAVEAASNGSITAMTTPSVVANDKEQAVGSVKFEIPKFSTLHDGDELVIELPFDMPKSSATDAAYNVIPGVEFSAFGSKPTDARNKLELRSVHEDDAMPTGGKFVINPKTSDEGKISLKYEGPDWYFDNDPAVFMLTLGALVIDSKDEAFVKFTAPGISPFPQTSGDGVRVATVADDKNSVNLSFGSLDTSNEDFSPKIVIEEPFAGALNSKDTEIRVKLPSGYVWTDHKEYKTVWGNFEAKWLDVNVDKKDDRELVIKVLADADNREKKTVSKVEIPFNFRVDDSTKVKKGDIIAKISGRTSANINEGKIGTYGEYEATLTAEDNPTLIAGQDEQEIADFHLTETIGESLVTGANGRYLELTLPEGARWQQEYVYDDGHGVEKENKPDKSSFPVLKDEGVTLTFDGFTGNNNRTAKFKVERDPKDLDAATLDFEDIEVALAADFTGDLKIAVSGSAGVKGEVTVAKVIAPVTATSKNAPEVIIGAREQKGADFTITENKAGALKNQGEVVLDLPEGVRFASKPTLKVTSGDLEISNVKLIKYNGTDDNAVSFRVDSESDTASTISVTDLNLILDRTVPEGTVTLSVVGGEGNAVAETAAYSDWEDNDTVAKVEVAKVSTPAPVEDSKGNTVSIFKIGSTSYTVNGATYTADVAPYIENGRTFLPVRYVADALGVAPQNIKFDKKTSTVTLLKGDRIVQIKLKTNILTVNGAVINMDVKAITKNNRTVLPISWVGQALGADIKWDKDTNTVTVTQVK
ncbi:copper amine oxidase N-terminal domain-containing protein [Paenibacillus macerans]|uniref:Copper amine oxidase N-terminal domain-containing protein n=1 Tax=Paenibacillus macerans TaxID=44252 RepID=A0A6N8EVN6_PAEMA|nr:copper amine oxidase N-terminal domain-containing protein [Paenibacillus macerans]MUG23674.1 copper amine oxidase N-terminal domain-containing protein [Paenibacillus macerans]